MPPLVGLLAAAIVGSLAFLFAGQRRRTRMRVWQEAARAAGLQDVVASPGLLDMQLQGRADHLVLHFENYRRGRYESGTRISIRRTPERTPALSVKREGLGTALGKELGAQEIEIGDATFDRECFVQGPPTLALAVLDRATRRTLAGVLGGYLPVGGTEIEVRASLDDGVLSVDLRDYPFERAAARVAAAVPVVLALARRLVPPPDLAGRLAENLRTEPEPGVRLQIVVLLAREFRDHPATHSALVAACSDPSLEVRLRAATALGQEGLDTLLALASREDAEDSCSARAVAALGVRLERPRLAATLEQARVTGRTHTACACLELLAARVHEDNEGLLVRALSDEQVSVRLAAARGLGRIGTASAVAPLLEAEGAGGGLRGVARQAIAEIQARLKGAAPGQLSLSAGEAGTLSLADDEPGRLSVVSGPEDLPSADGSEGEPAAARMAREPERSRQ
ncbi:MAG TPA: HEAT repeat domain-containing protein [Vicinamibacteria bacterium]|nr:HEAT repeat domain-containing protein [Vicinamibacteria bacterium]